MTDAMTLNVRVSGPLGKHVAANVGADGAYENVSEYVRDLIRRDRARVEDEAFNRLKAELTKAFTAPDETYEIVTFDDVIERQRRRRA